MDIYIQNTFSLEYWFYNKLLDMCYICKNLNQVINNNHLTNKSNTNNNYNKNNFLMNSKYNLLMYLNSLCKVLHNHYRSQLYFLYNKQWYIVQNINYLININQLHIIHKQLQNLNMLHKDIYIYHRHGWSNFPNILKDNYYNKLNTIQHCQALRSNNKHNRCNQYYFQSIKYMDKNMHSNFRQHLHNIHQNKLFYIDLLLLSQYHYIQSNNCLNYQCIINMGMHIVHKFQLKYLIIIQKDMLRYNFQVLKDPYKCLYYIMYNLLLIQYNINNFQHKFNTKM